MRLYENNDDTPAFLSLMNSNYYWIIEQTSYPFYFIKKKLFFLDLGPE